jgi:multidrug efflux pump subunit AcrB
MNLVSFALRRPISLLTMVVAVALVGFLALDRMSRDIFPDLGVPVLYVAQPYGGLDPAQNGRVHHQLLRVPLPLYHRH